MTVSCCEIILEMSQYILEIFAVWNVHNLLPFARYSYSKYAWPWSWPLEWIKVRCKCANRLLMSFWQQQTAMLSKQQQRCISRRSVMNFSMNSKLLLDLENEGQGRWRFGWRFAGELISSTCTNVCKIGGVFRFSHLLFLSFHDWRMDRRMSIYFTC